MVGFSYPEPWMAIKRWLTGVLAQNWSREMPQVENDKIVETATEARGAVTGHNVNYVLLISTIAVIVLFVVAYLLTKG
jgi:hypothetical protein